MGGRTQWFNYMVSVLDYKSSDLGLNQWLGSLHCVLGQDTLLSQYLFPPRCTNGYWVYLILDANPVTLVSHPSGSCGDLHHLA